MHASPFMNAQKNRFLSYLPISPPLSTSTPFLFSFFPSCFSLLYIHPLSSSHISSLFLLPLLPLLPSRSLFFSPLSLSLLSSLSPSYPLSLSLYFSPLSLSLLLPLSLLSPLSLSSSLLSLTSLLPFLNTQRLSFTLSWLRLTVVRSSEWCVNAYTKEGII